MATSLIVTAEEAATYFETRLFKQAWDDANDETQLAALTTAYNRLNAEYTLIDNPDTPEVQKMAIFDMALYLLQSGEGNERRAALQAAGVKKAGIVEETYDLDRDSTMIPASIVRMLKLWKLSSAEVHVGVVDLYRNENC